MVWDNPDFHGAGVSYAYDDGYGILYICGFYGPDCFAVDKNGNTLWECEEIDGNYYWPCGIALEEDRIAVTYDGCVNPEGDEGGKYIVSLNYDGTVYGRVTPSEIKCEKIKGAQEDGGILAESLKLTAVDADGGELWSYTTEPCILTELDTAEYIGTYGGLVYVNEQEIYTEGWDLSQPRPGCLLALDLYTGKVIWENEDFRGAGTAHAFDGKYGTLYICGFNGPDCFAVDKFGNTLFICDAVDPELYSHPYEIHLLDDHIEILFESGQGEGPLYGYINYAGEPAAG